MKIISLLVFSLFLFSNETLAEDKVIKEINARNALIKSVSCDVETIIVRRAVKLTSNGKLYYEKDKNLRLVTHAATDNKFMSDVGSNDVYFWVFARRLSPNYVAYANYKDIYKTNLKPSIDPQWMSDCLCLDVIDTSKASIQKQSNKLLVVQTKTSPRKTTTYKAIAIDPHTGAITGNYLYNSNKQMMAYAKVTSHYTASNGMKVPKTMETGAPDEDFTIEWTFSNYKFNVNIPIDVFKMPDLQIKRVNLATEQLRGLND